MAIPKHAKRVYKGKIFEVYHWRQKMFDGSFETFEAVKRQGTVVIIPTFKNKIVVLKQKEPHTGWHYSTPAGRMDVTGETPKQAALRELLEETGMKPKKIKLWKVIDKGGKIYWKIYVYIARDCRIVSGQKLDVGEKIEVQYYTFEQFLMLFGQPKRHIEESLWDAFRARFDKKYKKYFKKMVFG